MQPRRNWLWHPDCTAELKKLDPHPECLTAMERCVELWCDHKNGAWVKMAGDGLWEFKKKVGGSTPVRLYFTVDGHTGIGLKAHCKKGAPGQGRARKAALRRLATI